MTSGVTCMVTVLINGWGILQVLFVSFNKGPGGFPMYSSSEERSPHWNQYMAPLLLTIGSLSLGETSRFLMVLLPLMQVCMSYLPQITDLLDTFTETLSVGYNNETLGFNFIGSRLGTCCALVVSPIRSLTGRFVMPSLHLVQSPFWGICIRFSAFLRWVFSLWRSSGLLHTVWALWERVWITLNFAERWWWLSHCRYWSVWVGFLIPPGPKTNLTKAQSQAIRGLKTDRDCIVLTADKGVAMVIMDRQDYINKSKHLLNQPTYRAIPWNPTNTIKTN